MPPGTQVAPELTMFRLPSATLKAYQQIAETSQKNNQIMFVATATPHSIHNGIAVQVTEDFIKLRDLDGAEVCIGWTPGVYVGLTRAKLAGK